MRAWRVFGAKAPEGTHPPRRQAAILAIGILLIALAAVRILATGSARFTGDESDDWSHARRIVAGTERPAYGQPITGSEAKLPGPSYYYFFASAQSLGRSPRIGSVFVALLHGLCALLLAVVLWRSIGARAALVGTALLLFAPWDVLYGDRIWGSTTVPILGTLGLFGAFKARSSGVWLALGLFACLILPQFHLSTPVLWIACLTVVLLRPPTTRPWFPVLAGIAMATLTYVPMIRAELESGFANTRAILAQTTHPNAQSPHPWLSPFEVLWYAILYSTSEISYHFGRGYWGGYDDVARYLTLTGWRAAFEDLGGWLFSINVLSIVLAAAAWVYSAFVSIRAFWRLLKTRQRSAVTDAEVVLLAVFSGFIAAGTLLFLSRRLFFPHYANILMPMALCPTVFAIQRALAQDRPRLLRVVAATSLVISVGAMAWSTSRYYGRIDSLNGLTNTRALVRIVADEHQPVSVRFTHFNNEFAWNKLLEYELGSDVRVQPNARVSFTVHNRNPFEGTPPQDGFVVGSVLMTRRGPPRPEKAAHARTEAQPINTVLHTR
ncbi:MAG: hypothetical protein IPK13_24820 [Deltaproteobacteria bacterium]|nr:hypothetical protein [Deltaproteobacteria bacterium]